MQYNWQLDDWLNFTWKADKLAPLLLQFAERTGRLGGLVEGLNDKDKTEAVLVLMVSEAVKTSEIEGEYLSRVDVMSSIRNNLGLPGGEANIKNHLAKGAADLMTLVRQDWAAPLTEAMLFDWHAKLLAGTPRLTLGAWRTHTEPMQVVSGPLGKETVHFEAPPSKDLPNHMAEFIKWFNATGSDGENLPAPIRSGVAHLYFESLHPFEDGNGRIGRAISEKALSQGIGHPILFSLSQAIEAKRNDYYDALKLAQSSNEITAWLEYFLSVCVVAQTEAERTIRFVLDKAKFFDAFRAELNDRQLKALQRMFEAGPSGFEGGMSARKYIAITKTSKATATRDLTELAGMGALKQIGGGRNTRYQLPFVDEGVSSDISS